MKVNTGQQETVCACALSLPSIPESASDGAVAANLPTQVALFINLIYVYLPLFSGKLLLIDVLKC